MSVSGTARILRGAGLVLALSVTPGCQTCPRLPPLPRDAIKPVVAVAAFRNETGFSGQWELGRGVPDLLVAELLASERVVVVDRQNLPEVVGEITRQGNGLFRREDGVACGRLKNARYLVRGVITDFTQTGNATGWFRSPKAEAGWWGARARVMIALTIIDVETGEILRSIPAEGSAYASFKWARFNYRDVSFGGEAFFKTPIGVATRAAIRSAVRGILVRLPVTLWRPRVAERCDDRLVINGGANYGVRPGAGYQVREAGRVITDPTTGDPIDVREGRIVGQARITAVRELAADAVLVSGSATRGDVLDPAPSGQTPDTGMALRAPPDTRQEPSDRPDHGGGLLEATGVPGAREDHQP